MLDFIWIRLNLAHRNEKNNNDNLSLLCKHQRCRVPKTTPSTMASAARQIRMMMKHIHRILRALLAARWLISMTIWNKTARPNYHGPLPLLHASTWYLAVNDWNKSYMTRNTPFHNITLGLYGSVLYSIDDGLMLFDQRSHLKIEHEKITREGWSHIHRWTAGLARRECFPFAWDLAAAVGLPDMHSVIQHIALSLSTRVAEWTNNSTSQRPTRTAWAKICWPLPSTIKFTSSGEASGLTWITVSTRWSSNLRTSHTYSDLSLCPLSNFYTTLLLDALVILNCFQKFIP